MCVAVCSLIYSLPYDGPPDMHARYDVANDNSSDTATAAEKVRSS